MKAENIIEYIESRGKEFPRKLLIGKGKDVVLAGGSVANAILSITDNKKYPINDLDVFKYEGLNEGFSLKKGFQERIQSVDIVDSGGYPHMFKSDLYMVSREEEGFDMDIIGMETRNYICSNFPLKVITSFDLNCVCAGIYFDPIENDFVLYKTPEFNEFLETRQICVVNAHSKVTAYRALKKANDLEAYVDLETELSIVRHGCNAKRLKNLTKEQIEKHRNLIPQWNTFIEDELKKEPDPIIYSLFLGNVLQPIRHAKIKILRILLDPRYSKRLKDELWKVVNASEIKRKDDNDIFTLSIIYVACFYKGTFAEWFGSNQFDTKQVKRLDGFLNDHSNIRWLFLNKTLSEMIEISEEIKKMVNKYGMIFIGALESLSESTDIILSPLSKSSDIDFALLRGKSLRTIFAHTLLTIRKMKKEDYFFKDSGKKLPDLYFKDNIEIKELSSNWELIIQGNQQGHCVGGYGRQVLGGSCRILSVTNHVTGEQSTVQLSTPGTWSRAVNSIFRISQHKGRFNQDPGEYSKKVVKDYVKTLNEMEDIKDYLIPSKKKIGQRLIANHFFDENDEGWVF